MTKKKKKHRTQILFSYHQRNLRGETRKPFRINTYDCYSASMSTFKKEKDVDGGYLAASVSHRLSNRWPDLKWSFSFLHQLCTVNYVPCTLTAARQLQLMH